MKRYFAFLLLVPTFLSTVARAQLGYTIYCNAGLRPDGYVDFSELPPAPNTSGSSNGTASSAPITVTLPVHGIPGLTVQLTFTYPYYGVTNGTLSLTNGDIYGDASLGLQFSQPVGGMGILGTVAGRGANFSLSTTGPGTELAPPLNYMNSSTANTSSYHYFTYPLEAVATRGTSLILANITAGGQGAVELANLRVQSAAAASSSSNTVPTEGLELWLKSESATSQYAQGAASWPDYSGKGHDATQTVQANQPYQVEADGPNCQGAFTFSRNQFFNFDLPIDGWKEMTVFLVGKSLVDPSAGSWAAYSAGILWNENALWGNTFVTPYQKSVAFRFGTDQVGNQPLYSRPVTIGQDFTVTRAVHNESTDSLYVDGQLVLRQAGKLPVLSGTSGAGFIGRGINNTYFTGEISEILVYDRVLTAKETSSVEFYLRNKFGTR